MPHVLQTLAWEMLPVQSCSRSVYAEAPFLRPVLHGAYNARAQEVLLLLGYAVFYSTLAMHRKGQLRGDRADVCALCRGS